MKYLSEIMSRFKFSVLPDLKWGHGMKISGAILLIFLSVSYCFRENVLQKVEVYQSEGTVPEVQYYIEILSVMPAAGASDVSLNSHIDVVFNDNIDMLTVDDATTFTVNDGTGNVSGTFVYDAALKNIEFTQTGGFTANSTYTVTLTTGIKNPVGESMAADYSWSFATVTASLPEIFVLSPLSEMFTGGTYDFGTVQTAATSTQSFSIGNSGSSNLVINLGDITITGSDFILFPDPTPLTILPGSTASFDVNFTPAVAGLKNSVLIIANNDADEPFFTINLTGMAVDSPEPEIQITNGGTILVSGSTVVDFGTVPIGSTGSITLVMHNIGSDDLTVTALSEGGNNPEFFATDFAPVPSTITSGNTKSFNVTFSPTGNGNKKADLIFQNNDSDEASFAVKVKGRGN